MKNKKGLTVFIIFLIVIILLGSANIILSTFGITNSNTETIKQKDMEKSNWGYIASVKISGVAFKHHQQIKKRFFKCRTRNFY